MEQYILNKELNDQEIKAQKLVLESKPRKLAVILTTKCNLNCIMCPMAHFRASHRQANTLAYDTIKKIYQLYPYLQWIDWQGGEVFLIDYFKELFLKAASFPQIQQNIITNGLLIDDEWAKILTQNNVELTYSIDSVQKDRYEQIRKGAKFDKLIKSIETVNKYRNKYHSSIHFILNVVVMKCNYRELSRFSQFCKDYGFNHLRLDYLRHDVATEEDLFIDPEKETIDYLNRQLRTMDEDCKKNGIDFSHSLGSFLNIDSFALEDSQEKSFTPECKIPWRKITIEDSGGVRLDCKCPRLIGNIYNDSLEDIWNGPMIQSYRRAILSKQMQEFCSSICLNNAVEKIFFEGI